MSAAIAPQPNDPAAGAPNGEDGMRSVIAVIAAAAVVIAWSPRADAAEPPDAARTSLSDAEIERRLDFIEQRLEASKRHAQIWYWSWLTINGGATIALSVAASIADDADDRAAYIPQAALAALGVADLTLIRPLRRASAPSRFETCRTARARSAWRNWSAPKRCCAATPNGPPTAGPGCCISPTSASTPPRAR
jgi:hypothetical protein